MNRRKFIIRGAGITTATAFVPGCNIAQDNKKDGMKEPEAYKNEVINLAEQQQIVPVRKSIYHKAKKRQQEGYQPVINDKPGSELIAFIRVNGTTESLVLKDRKDSEERIISADTYIFNPVFLGGELYWIEKEGENWKIKFLNLTDNRNRDFVKHWGRPLSIQGFDLGDRQILVWEERKGKKTKLFIGQKRGNNVSAKPLALAYNAYDPVCAVSKDNNIYIAFSGFYHGNYHTFIQKLDMNVKPLGTPYRITHGKEANVYPSIVPAADKGIWISYTKYAVPFDYTTWVMPYTEHTRKRQQYDFFQTHGLIHAGYYDGENIYAPYAPDRPGSVNGAMAAMIVFGSTGGGRSKILLTKDGRIRLLFRKYDKKPPLNYNKEDILSRKTNRNNAYQMHPNLCISTLLDQQWSEPVTLVSQAHFDGDISLNLQDIQLRVSFADDGRQTGGRGSGEWFDFEHEVGLGILTLNLKAFGKPQYELRPYVVKVNTGTSMEEPVFESKNGSNICAKGQTHKHTNHSICTREFDRDHHLNFRFLQDVLHCDYGAMSDHSHNFWDTEVLYMNKISDYYYFPGEFVALPGYEWTAKEGHINPLYFEEKGSFAVYQPEAKDLPGSTFEELWKEYKGQKVLTPPHHMADAMLPFDWEKYNNSFMPVAEIFQDNRGSCEQPEVPGVTNYLHVPENDKKWVVDQLNTGKKIGIMASADHTGVAQAFAMVKELTRTALYDAFQAKNCFGSTGMSLILDFSCNNQPMGSEIRTQQADFKVFVKAPEEIAEIQVLRNGKSFKDFKANGKESTQSWSANKKNSGEYWYCRVLFENGEMAWSSPIWLV